MFAQKIAFTATLLAVLSAAVACGSSDASSPAAGPSVADVSTFCSDVGDLAESTAAGQGSADGATSCRTRGLIRHVVLVRPRHGASPAEWSSIVDGLRALAPRLDGVVAVHTGPNATVEEGMDKGYTAGVSIDFIDAEARDAYLAHPGHAPLSDRLLAYASGGANGIVVFDLKI